MTTPTPESPAHDDLTLVHEVTQALLKAPQVDPTTVRVAVTNGRVTLTGEVATHAQRLAVARIAAQVPGATGVDNVLSVAEIDLGASRRSDDELTDAVRDAVADSTVPVADLAIDVHQRVASVSGRVATERERAALRHAIQEVPGVHFVKIRIQLEGDAVTHEIEELDPDTSFRLLATDDLGRLAVQEASGVDIFPVNYLAHDGKVYFRSGPGVKMIRVTDSPDVAFEADGRDGEWAWSVVVKGTATRLDDDDEIIASGVLDSRTDHPSAKLNYVRIQPRQITGRRFRRAQG